MKEVIFPPSRRYEAPENWSVFLAGTIDMGAGREWQKDFIDRFPDTDPVTFFNPRRPGAFKGEQTLENELFTEQVNWEIDRIRSSDIVVMYITAESKSPISLLEFGYCLAHEDVDHVIIGVEKGFWRRGNIEVMCNRFGIPLYEDLDDVERQLRDTIAYLADHD